MRKPAPLAPFLLLPAMLRNMKNSSFETAPGRRFSITREQIKPAQAPAPPVKGGDLHINPRGVYHATRVTGEDLNVYCIFAPPQAGGNDKTFLNK